MFHGIGEYSDGWMDQESTAVTGIRKAALQYPFFQNLSLDEDVEFVPVLYNDVFQRIWNVGQRHIGGCPNRKRNGVSISRLRSLTCSIVRLTAKQAVCVFSTAPGPKRLMLPAGMPNAQGVLDIPNSTEIWSLLGQSVLIAIVEACVSQGLKDRVGRAIAKDTLWSELGKHGDEQPAEMMRIQLYYLAFLLVGVYFLVFFYVFDTVLREPANHFQDTSGGFFVPRANYPAGIFIRTFVYIT